uniref:Uncharacterized protein n=1 Tax=Siphoviridae sp. ctJjf17 TaxID=2827839 RepID=A0A8S5SB24_9CAUD|nr:MAG TPA: hypothetical protein [Siphoviridae sp. ctJjf17]
MEVQKIKAAKDSLNIAIELLKECEQDVRLLEIKRDDIDELIESKSIRPFNKLKELNQNQEIVLEELKRLDDDFIISTICKFSDSYAGDTEVEIAFTSLNGKEELEVIESFTEYLRSK